MKYVIEKKRSRGYITPIPTGELITRLINTLQYTKQGAEFMSNPAWAIVKMYSTKTHSFPYGLVSRVCDIIKDIGDEVELKNAPKLEPILPHTFSSTIRDYQIEADKALIRNNGGIISVPTGGGKTFIMNEWINCYNVKTLVVVPTIDIRSQWEEVVDKDKVDVKTYHSIKFKEDILPYKLVIFDEVHHVGAKVLYKIAMNCGHAVLAGCSATTYREDGEDMKIEAALGKVIFRIQKRELIDLGYLCDAEVRYISLHESSREYLDYHEAYDKYIVYNEERNKRIVGIASKSQKPTLILVKKVEHGENLLNDIKESGRNDVIFINGSISKKKRVEMFKQIQDGLYGVVIATSLFDEGVNVPNFEILILAVGGKSSIKVVQRVGRVLRTADNKTKAIVYDFIDDYKFLSEHYVRRRDILAQDFEIKYDWQQKTLDIGETW